MTKIENIHRFSNQRKIFKLELDNFRKNGIIEVTSKVNGFELSFLLTDKHFEKAKAINALTKENENDIIDKKSKIFLINLFSPCIKDFLEGSLSSNNISSIVVVFLRIYKFCPKDANFIIKEIPKIITILLEKKYITLDSSTKLKFITRNQIDDFNTVKTIFVNIIRNLLNDEFFNWSKIKLLESILENIDILKDFIETELPDIIKSLLNNNYELNNNDKLNKIELLELMLKNKENRDIFKDFIKIELPNIIKFLLNNDFYGKSQIKLIELVLQNKDIFSSFIETEFLNIIRSLLNDGSPSGFETGLIKLVLQNKDIFSSFIETELSDITDSLLNNNSFNESKTELIKLVLQNKDFIETELPGIAKSLLEDDIFIEVKIKLLELKSEIEKTIKLLKVKEMNKEELLTVETESLKIKEINEAKIREMETLSELEKNEETKSQIKNQGKSI